MSPTPRDAGLAVLRRALLLALVLALPCAAQDGPSTAGDLAQAARAVDDLLARGDAEPAVQALEAHRALIVGPALENDQTVWADRAAWAETLSRLGLAGAVRPAAEEALDRLEDLLPADDFGLVLGRSQLAVVRTMDADPQGACDLLGPLVAELASQRFVDPWVRVVLGLQHGRALLDAGRPAEARSAAEAALALLEDMPQEVATRGQARSLLADSQMLLGDVEAALASQRSALQDLEAGLGAGHLEVLEARRLVAYLFWELGQAEAAREAFAALAEGPDDGSPRARAVRWSARGYEGWVLVTQGRAERARELLTALLESDPGPGVTELERRVVEHVLARALHEAGEVDQALARIADLLPHLEGRPGAEEVLLHTLGLAAEARLAAGDDAGATAAARRLIGALSARLDGLVLDASQRELEAAPVAHASELGQLTRVALARPELVAEVVALCERLRGLGLATARWVRRPPSSERVAALQRTWRAAEQQLAQAAASADEAALDRARQQRDQAQRQLVGALAAGDLPGRPGAEDLPEGTLALGYLAVVGPGGAPELVATLRRRGEPPALVHLGRLEPVRHAISCWRAALGVPSTGEGACEDGSIRRRGAALAALVLAPLAPWIDAADRLLILPDDQLHLVPLDALPWGQGHLGDRVRCHRGWGLVDGAAPADDGSLLLVGALDFGPTADGSGADVESFAALPASADELALVAGWRTRHGPAGADLRRLVGDQADLATLAREAAGVSTVHLATHAWARPLQARRGQDLLAGLSSARALTPLLSTGLALSGANAGAGGRLNGEQLAGLDLEACRLAVLAGCATNTGALRTWQGVASLTKAAHMAGARAVVASLWPVEDRWTRRLMDVFYQGLWEQGLSPEDALWQARQVVREEGRLPRRWAGWVLSRVGPDE